MIPGLAVLVSEALDSDRLCGGEFSSGGGGKIPAMVSSYVGGSSWYDLWSSIPGPKQVMWKNSMPVKVNLSITCTLFINIFSISLSWIGLNLSPVNKAK